VITTENTQRMLGWLYQLFYLPSPMLPVQTAQPFALPAYGAR
jgi:hypothetical protein